MNSVQKLLTDHIDIWTDADTEKKSGRGRISGNAASVYGIRKLRELILDLAMRGKLIEQDQNDEPPYDALKKTKHWPLKEDKNSGHIPDSWISVPLEVLAADTKYPIGDGDHGQINPACYTDLGVPYIRVADLGWGTFEPNGLVHIPESVHEQNLKSELRPGDILIAKTGATIGKCCIVPASIPRANTTSSVGKVTVNQGLVLPKWIICNFLSGGFKEKMWAVSKKTAQPGFNIINLKNFVVPVPSIAEQHRIVAKVDELMALCDQLETRHNNAAEAHEKLLSLLLATLTQSQNAADFSANWQRIAAHFDTLFSTEASIDALKQTLLQLAVMGKLVPQDPNDEPASALLKRIQAEKTRLVAEGKIKKDKPLSPIADDEMPFALPRGWEWARLQSVIDVRDGTHDSPKEAGGLDAYPLVTSKDFFEGRINFDTARRISEADYLKISKRSLVEKYDILFSMIGGNIGNQVLVNDDRPFSIKNVALFKYYDKNLTFPFFIKKYMEDLAVNLQATAVGGAQPFVALGALRNLVMALPPLAEQHRIVAKVDELMALCDQLKTRITEANQLQQKLADVVVEQAIA